MSTTPRKMGMTPPHPGEFIRDEILAELSLSVSEAADVLGVRRATLSDLINGKAALSPEMALRVEKAVPPRSVGRHGYVAKPMTSSAKAEGRCGKEDFVYLAEENVYRCPTGEKLHEDLFEAVQKRLDQNPHAMRTRRETSEHPFGTMFTIPSDHAQLLGEFPEPDPRY